jgi:hypothetical protein
MSTIKLKQFAAAAWLGRVPVGEVCAAGALGAGACVRGAICAPRGELRTCQVVACEMLGERAVCPSGVDATCDTQTMTCVSECRSDDACAAVSETDTVCDAQARRCVTRP